MSGFYVTEDGCIMKGCGIESDSHGVFLENDYMRGYYVDPAPLVDYTKVWTEDGREGIVNGGFVTWGFGDNDMLECVYSNLTTYPVPRTKDDVPVRKGMTLYDECGNEFVVRSTTQTDCACWTPPWSKVWTSTTASTSATSTSRKPARGIWSPTTWV